MCSAIHNTPTRATRTRPGVDRWRQHGVRCAYAGNMPLTEIGPSGESFIAPAGAGASKGSGIGVANVIPSLRLAADADFILRRIFRAMPPSTPPARRPPRKSTTTPASTGTAPLKARSTACPWA
jgi:hypothetical protein